MDIFNVSESSLARLDSWTKKIAMASLAKGCRVRANGKVELVAGKRDQGTKAIAHAMALTSYFPRG